MIDMMDKWLGITETKDIPINTNYQLARFKYELESRRGADYKCKKCSQRITVNSENWCIFYNGKCNGDISSKCTGSR